MWRRRSRITWWQRGFVCTLRLLRRTQYKSNEDQQRFTCTRPLRRHLPHLSLRDSFNYASFRKASENKTPVRSNAGGNNVGAFLGHLRNLGVLSNLQGPGRIHGFTVSLTNPHRRSLHRCTAAQLGTAHRSPFSGLVLMTCSSFRRSICPVSGLLSKNDGALGGSPGL